MSEIPSPVPQPDEAPKLAGVPEFIRQANEAARQAEAAKAARLAEENAEILRRTEERAAEVLGDSAVSSSVEAPDTSKDLEEGKYGLGTIPVENPGPRAWQDWEKKQQSPATPNEQ